MPVTYTQTLMPVANTHKELCDILIDFLTHRRKHHNGSWVIGVGGNSFIVEGKTSAQKPAQYIDINQLDITTMRVPPKTNIFAYNYYIKLYRRT